MSSELRYFQHPASLKDLSRYIGFDFHEQCKGMRYENISKLTSQLEGDMKDYEYVCPPLV